MAAENNLRQKMKHTRQCLTTSGINHAHFSYQYIEYINTQKTQIQIFLCHKPIQIIALHYTLSTYTICTGQWLGVGGDRRDPKENFSPGANWLIWPQMDTETDFLMLKWTKTKTFPHTCSKLHKVLPTTDSSTPTGLAYLHKCLHTSAQAPLLSAIQSKCFERISETLTGNSYYRKSTSPEAITCASHLSRKCC